MVVRLLGGPDDGKTIRHVDERATKVVRPAVVYGGPLDGATTTLAYQRCGDSEIFVFVGSTVCQPIAS